LPIISATSVMGSACNGEAGSVSADSVSDLSDSEALMAAVLRSLFDVRRAVVLAALLDLLVTFPLGSLGADLPAAGAGVESGVDVSTEALDVGWRGRVERRGPEDVVSKIWVGGNPVCEDSSRTT
jgi:hypothetical protein